MVLSSIRAGPGNATCVSPARARRCPADRSVRDQRKASARPGGGEAPAWGGAGAGRVLWPPAGEGSAWRCGRGDGPCHGRGEGAFAPPGGNRKRDPRFPRPCATVPCRPVGPGPKKGQRPTRRGGRWPGALGPRSVLIPVQHCGRGDGPCHCSGGGAFVSAGGNRKRDPRFPRPCGTVRRRPAGPRASEASARQGRGGRLPRALAPGRTRISVALWQGRWPLPLKRGQCLHQCGQDQETRCVSGSARTGSCFCNGSGWAFRPASGRDAFW